MTGAEVMPQSQQRAMNGSEQQSSPIVREVMREFGGPEGRVYKRGEVVDVTNWRHAGRLVEQHKLSDYLVN